MSSSDLKQEVGAGSAAPAAAEHLFHKDEAADKAKLSDFDLHSDGGHQDDNNHTEQLFSNEQKDIDFDSIDPQDFVQRMSAGAKETQEQLDAKFSAQPLHQEMDDIFSVAVNTANQRKQELQDHINLTRDFMQAERGGSEAPKKPLADSALAGIQTAFTTVVSDDYPVKPGSDKAADLLNSQFPMHHSAQTRLNDDDLLQDLYEDEVGGRHASKFSKFGKDSDNDSPSISYTPSPAKKISDQHALTDTDNEKFISSENILVDIKNENSAAEAASSKPSAFSSVPTTDLDDDSNENDFTKQSASLIDTKTSTIKPAATDAVKEKLASFSNEALIPQKEELPKPTTSHKRQEKPSGLQEIDDSLQPKLLSVEQLFYKYGLDAWFKPERLHPQVESLIYWRDVKKSGIVFGVGVSTILAISCYSVISVFAWLSLLLLAAAVAFRCYKIIMQALQKTSDGHPFEEFLKFDLTISQEKVQNVAGVAVAHINGFTAELRRLFLVEDFVDSIKFGFLLYVLTYIGAWLNGMTLVLLAYISLLTLPKLYENNKESIDTYLDMVLSKITEVSDKVKAALPMTNKKPVVAESDKDK